MNRIRFGSRSFFIFTLAIFLAGAKFPALRAQTSQTPANFKIAFIGDQGLGLNSEAVLTLIKNEGAGALLIAGDLDYEDNPPAWDDQINRILGENFPCFALIGNHDTGSFFGPGGYQSFMMARMNRLGIPWQGNLGVQSFFTYQGILFVMTAPGVNGDGHETYIRDVLAADNSIWSISSWHRNMQLMQVGDKSDDTGWGVYEESRKGGAIIATAHEHSYSRTHLLSNFQNQTVADASNTLILTNDDAATPADEGNSFAFVSGLGGKSIRSQKLSGNWWASIYTKTQGAVDGALFGVFNANGVANRAEFYFKAVDGATPDNFVVISNVSSSPPAQYSLTANAIGSGSVSLNPSGGLYNSGTAVTLTAAPEAGYQFDGWSGDLTGSTNPVTITMDANKNITATFTQIPITQYSLTVNPVGLGSVALNPTGGLYDSGTEVALMATPEAGYQFSGWSGDLSGSSNPATITMDANKTVTATFTLLPPQYTLTANTVGSGNVSLNPSGALYNSGAQVTLTATPNAGYQFSGWSGDLSGVSNPATITMDANKTVTATFTVIDLSGQVVHQETATGSSSSSTTVATSASLTAMSGQLYLAAISMDAKVAVSSVSGLGLNWTLVKAQCSGKNKTGIEVWMAQGTPNSSGTVTATFVSKPSYAVIAVSRYANVDAVAPIGNMVSGNTVGVNGACSGGVDGKTYSFNLSTTVNGAVVYGAAALRDRSHTPGPGYTERADIKKSKAAVAVEDKVMTSAGATILNGTFSGSVDWAVIGLEIRPQTSGGTQYTLTTNVVGLGSVTPANGSYSAGVTVMLTATPGAGYQFAGWSGALSGSTNPATLTMDANKNATATFTPITPTQYTVTVNTTGSGSVTLNPIGGTYDAGTVVTLTATPEAGYQFAGWSGDLTGSTNPTALTMNANKSVTATFTPITPTQYTLTINTTGSGSVTLNPAGGTYDSGTVVTLTATPNSGFQFAGWSGDLTGATNPAMLTMNANKNVTANFSVIGGSGQVVHEETVSGGSSALTTVSTSASLTGVSGHLYLAAISGRSHVAVTSVSGLGLTWTKVQTQCSGRNITGVDVWMAQGAPTGNGVVTATLTSAPNAAVIIVSRYSGVDAVNPIGALVSGNTVGVSGACSGGVDNAAYSFNLTTSVSGAMVYGAIAVRNRTNTPGPGYTERAELLQAGSSSAALAVQDQSFATAGAATFNGTTSSAVDWAVMALEIKPQLSLSKRHASAAKENLPPAEFTLEANYPNPFSANGTLGNPSTAINFSLPVAAVVRLNVYDVAGHLVRVLATGEMAAGRYSEHWNGYDNFNRVVAAGTYLYQIIVETEDGKILFSQTRRMTLLK